MFVGADGTGQKLAGSHLLETVEDPVDIFFGQVDSGKFPTMNLSRATFRNGWQLSSVRAAAGPVYYSSCPER